MSDDEPASSHNHRTSSVALLCLASALAGIGVTTFWFGKVLQGPPSEMSLWPAVFGVLLAVAALVVGGRSLRKQREFEDEGGRESRWLGTGVRRAPGRGARFLALLSATLLMSWVLWQLPGMFPGASHRLVTWMWLVAAAMYLLAVTPAYSLSRDTGAAWQGNPRQWLILAGILFSSFVLRFWQVGTLPFALSGDEASQGLEAVRVLDDALRNPFTTGWLGVPTASFFVNSWSMGVFGRTVFALRFPWVLVGTATVLVVFFLVRRLSGTRPALATTGILAVYHYHIHYSRLGSNQIADPFFLALTLLFLYRALDRKNPLDWALTGMVSAAALYFYAGARLTPVVLIVVLGYLFLQQPRPFFAQHGRGILISVGAFLLVGAPMIQYGILFPDDFNARLNQVGIIQSGWLAREMTLLNTGPLPILLEQFSRAMLAFNLYPDRTVWYGLREPLLSPFWGVLLLVGLGYAMLGLIGRGANPRYAPMVAWWWGGMLLGGFLTESPPSSQRLITVAVPVCFFLAEAMRQLIRLGSGLFRKGCPRQLANGLLIGGIGAFAVTSVKLYFVEYLPLRIYGGSNAELATEIAPRLRSLQTDHEIRFVGPPHMYWGFATLPYLVPNASARDIREPLHGPADVEAIEMDRSKGAVFVFHPLRADEYEHVRTAFPGGRYEKFVSPVDGRLMTALYVLPPGFRK